MVKDDRTDRRLALESIPEMTRPVGLFGSLRRTEVGGSVCFSAIVTMGMYQSRPQSD